MSERQNPPVRNRQWQGVHPLRSLFALPLIATILAGCGGGGGGEATYSLQGKLRLEQEPVPLGLVDRDRVDLRPLEDPEPNDQLFAALDLGDLDADFDGARLSGHVGGSTDRRDVMRLGAVAPELDGRTLRIETEASDARVVLHTIGAGAPAQSLPDGATTLLLREGHEFAIVIESDSPVAWRIDVSVVDDTATPHVVLSVPRHLSRTDADRSWDEVLGGESFRFLPGEVVVSGEKAQARLAALGFERVSGDDEVGRYRSRKVVYPQDRRAAQLVHSDLIRDVRRALPDAAAVSPNVVTPLEEALAGMPSRPLPLEPNDKFWKSGEQFNLALTKFEEAWSITTGSDDVHIAVVDTGMMVKHPDLAARVSSHGYDFIADAKSAGDGNGVDPDPSEPPEFDIYFFHGTYVGGIATAVSNNSIGISGGAWKGKVIPIRVFGALGGTSYDRVQAYRYLAGESNDSGKILPASERPKVINLSFAIPIPTAAEHAEIKRLYAQNVKMVAAIDNQGLDPAPALYPAAWPEVLCCSAVDEKLVRASYSNAADYVDICAPGGTALGGPKGVVTTWALRLQGKLTYVYNSFLGTSVATPAVTAALALMESVHPNLHPELARRILADTCKDLGPAGKDRYYGHGLLQADAAVKRAQAAIAPPILSMTPQAYRFTDTEATTSLTLTNTGGRLLTNFGVSSIGQVSDALSFRVPMFAPDDLIVTLDRDKSRVGNHQEFFRLRSNGGDLRFDLSWRRPIPVAPQSFEVWLSRDGRLVRKTTSAVDGSFSFDGLGAGTYYLEAGVDRDQNGRLGDEQEWYLGRTVQVDGAPVGNLGDVIPWKN